jgi:sugar-specific transcriptional regulator TrmB
MAVNQEQRRDETVELLQELGLKEYEARCFVALTQVPAATAKEISDVSEVPRTRVYDAIHVLEGKGLVEVQHSTPKRFRSVGVEEGIATLRRRFDARFETLQSHLESLEIQPEGEAVELVQEVWSLSGNEAIESRMLDRFDAADSEVVLLVVNEDLLTAAVFERLRAAIERGVDVVVGGRTDTVVSRVESELPSAAVFQTDLGWLVGPEDESAVAISRLALVDQTALLVSSFYPDEGAGGSDEQAVVADGLENGVVVLVRRLIASGLSPSNADGAAASH